MVARRCRIKVHAQLSWEESRMASKRRPLETKIDNGTGIRFAIETLWPLVPTTIYHYVYWWPCFNVASLITFSIRKKKQYPLLCPQFVNVSGKPQCHNNTGSLFILELSFTHTFNELFVTKVFFPRFLMFVVMGWTLNAFHLSLLYSSTVKLLVAPLNSASCSFQLLSRHKKLIFVSNLMDF